jgi:hypothetical protein
MFSPDIVAFRQFYTTPLGEAVRGLIARALHELWPGVGSDAVLGIGYCAPYLESLVADGAHVTMCMPAHQGAAAWPPGANLVFLAHESDLPLRENSLNRVLLLHSVENSEHLSWMMEEVWRTLTPGGRVLAIVPNRLGFWSRSSKSPFGYGRPFSMAQLRDLMADHHFTLTRCSSALFIPPTHFKLVWRMADKLEAIGKFLCPFIGGVLLIEAEKQLYAAIRQPAKARKLYGVIPAPKPAMGMK